MRKTIDITISAEGRDHGKVFHIEEMPASQAEKWAARAFLALSRSGAEIPDDVRSAGFAGIAVLGLKALGGMRFEDAEQLMDEMFDCIRIKPDKRNPDIIRSLIEDDIEEIATRVRLRAEVFGLHAGFSLAGLLSKPTEETPADSSTIQTSPQRSAPRSQAAKRHP